MHSRIETVKHWGNLSQTCRLNEQALKGELSREDWGITGESLSLNTQGHWLNITGTADGEFMMLVSAQSSQAVPMLNYHIGIEDAFDMLPRSLRPWLVDWFRQCINTKLEHATSELGLRLHRSARSLMAEAMELSIRLQSIEHDAQDDVVTGVFGGMRMAVTAFEGAPKLVSHNERRYGAKS